MKTVKTSNCVEYEIDCFGIPRNFTAEYSCENNCTDGCRTRCPAGAHMVKGIVGTYDITGA